MDPGDRKPGPRTNCPLSLSSVSWTVPALGIALLTLRADWASSRDWGWRWWGRVGSLFLHSVKVTQSCPALCNPMDYTVPGTLQARILKWVAFPFSRGSSQPRDRTQVSHIAGRFFTSSAPREAFLHIASPKHRKIPCEQPGQWC